MITPCLLGVLLFSEVKHPEQIDSLLDVMIFASVINFAVCLFELATGVNLSYLLCTDGTAVYIPLERSGLLRVAGAFVNPINNGMYCIFVLILCLYRLTRITDTAGKRILWGIYACNWIVMVLTASRAVLLIGAAANGLLIMVLFFQRIKKFLPYVGAALAAAMVFVIYAYELKLPVTEKLNDIVLPFLQIADDLLGTYLVRDLVGDLEVPGVGTRMELYEWVPGVLKNKWFGDGRGANFGKAVFETYGRRKNSIENQYLRELYRHGIVSLCGKVLFFAGTLVYSLRWAIREWKAKQVGLNTFLLTAYAFYFEKSCALISDADALKENVCRSRQAVMARADRFANALEQILLGEL